MVSVEHLARVAFEAYMGTVCETVRWSDLSDVERSGWMAAVEATLRAGRVGWQSVQIGDRNTQYNGWPS